MANLAHLSQVLVVEDEALILLDVESSLIDAGVAAVATATTVPDALAIIESRDLDAAILDLHLGVDTWTYDIAKALKAKSIPFIFSSGTVDVAEGFREVPLILKPFRFEQLVTALLQVTADRQAHAAQ